MDENAPTVPRQHAKALPPLLCEPPRYPAWGVALGVTPEGDARDCRVAVDGCTTVFQWGRRHMRGELNTIEHATPQRALDAALRFWAERENRGYRPASGVVPLRPGWVGESDDGPYAVTASIVRSGNRLAMSLYDEVEANLIGALAQKRSDPTDEPRGGKSLDAAGHPHLLLVRAPTVGSTISFQSLIIMKHALWQLLLPTVVPGRELAYAVVAVAPRHLPPIWATCPVVVPIGDAGSAADVAAATVLGGLVLDAPAEAPRAELHELVLAARNIAAAQDGIGEAR